MVSRGGYNGSARGKKYAQVPYKRPLRYARPFARRQRAPANARTGGFSGVELKYIDNGLDDATLLDSAWTGALHDPTTVNCLFATKQGTGPTDRDGRKLIIKSIFVRGNVKLAHDAGAAGADATVARVLLVQDTQTNGAQLNPIHVMASGVGTGVHQFRNLEYSKRFRVLGDKTMVLNPQSSSGDTATVRAGEVKKSFSFFLKCNIPVTYNATADPADISQIMDNSFHILAMGDDASPAGSLKLSYNCRARFVG